MPAWDHAMKQTRYLLTLVGLLAFMATSCQDNALVAPTEGVGFDASPQDIGSMDATMDIQEVVEVTAPDAIQETEGVQCEPGEGCFLEACETNDDCLSGVCVPHMGDSVCSEFCEAECPDGWACKQVNVGASDVAFICVSNFSQLCVPCDDNADCASEGGQTICVSYGDEGAFCGASCEGNQDCPGDFVCETRDSVDGGQSNQCVPANGALCECSGTSATLGLSTPCIASNEFGTCDGMRTCSTDGLSDCSAQVASDESCNGLDDNCDGNVDEGTCDDGDACTEDSCDGAQGCVHTPLDGPACDDGDACTIADYCQAGTCAGAALECVDDNPCTVDTCDSDTGCAFPHYAGACNDGDDCTFGDYCQEGACVAGLAMACDDGNPCTEDACDAELGCKNAAVDGACDDGNACTQGDACVEGNCWPTEVVDCDDGNPCTDEACDLATGCASAPNEAPCNDGNACTTDDACSASVCQGEALECDDGNPCTDEACNELLGCTTTNNSAPCDDADPCTTTDQCSLGNCLGLGAVDCDDGNPCTLDLCEPMAGCDHQAKEGPCDDADACSVGDACEQGLCLGGPDTLACDDNNPCTNESCDKDAGCVKSFNEVACDDGNACLIEDVCQQGVCSGSDPLACDDGNLCTTDSCDAKNGCIHTPNAAPCNDGNVCTINDVCNDGDCEIGSPMVCEDGNPCTNDSCDPNIGCQFEANAAVCDDGNACTTLDACSKFACQGTEELVCDDANPCTDDLCDAIEGCVSFNNVQPCDDGTACTEDDGCSNGTCNGTPIGCDDGNVCTTDSCDDVLGCVSTNNNALGCDDGDACTGPDGCQDGGCIGSPIVCDDENPCTNEACDAAVGCIITHDDANDCDDGSACTGADHCSAGECTGVDIVCDDGNKCSSDFCDPAVGCQAEAITPCCGNGVQEDGEECDGGNACTDTCEEKNATVPGFSGQLGPDFAANGWLQCEGYYDSQNAGDIPAAWGDDCTGAEFGQVRLVCGATSDTYRYIDVKKNVFKDGLAGYQENGLITAANDQSGNSFSIDNTIYADSNHPHNGTSWWNGGNGCGEDNQNMTVNNGCPWEASNCFGQGIGGPRFLWVYVKP